MKMQRLLTRSEKTAGLERVSGVASWARADGLVVFYLAVSACTASAVARVHALELVASLVVGAVVMSGALGVAPARGETLGVKMKNWKQFKHLWQRVWRLFYQHNYLGCIAYLLYGSPW